MSSLRDSIGPLESDLKAMPPRINVYHDLPFAIMRYDPTDEWELRREIKLLATRLEAVGKDVQIIRAIRQTASLLTVYHQQGQVKVPHAAKDIYAYFEDALVPLLPSGAFTSFHPKTWILRYANAESRFSDGKT